MKRYLFFLFNALLCTHLVASNVCEFGTDHLISIQASSIGQTFVAPITGNLRQVLLTKTGNSINATAQLFSGQLLDFSQGVPLAQTALVTSSSTYEAIFAYAPVTAGLTYTVAITAAGQIGLSQGDYANGNAVLNGTAQNFDLAFSFCFSAVEFDSRLATRTQYGSSKQATVLDKDNNVILFGTLGGEVHISANTTYATEWDQGFLAKYDNTSDHNLIWYLTLVTDIQNYFLEVLPNGDILVAATYWSFAWLKNEGCGGPSDADIFIARFSGVDGSELWHQCYINYGPQYVISLAVSEENHVYVTGITGNYGTINFGGGDVGGFNSGSWIAKLDLNGTHFWSNAYENTLLVAPSDVYDNTLTIAGTLSGPTAIDGQYIPHSPPDTGIIVQLSAQNGSSLWYRTITSEYGTTLLAVDVNSKGESVVAGTSTGIVTLDSLQLNDPAAANLLIAKYDANGNCVWGKMLGNEHSAGGSRPLSSVRIGNQDTIFVSGQVCSDYSLCSMNLGGETIPANSGFFAAFDTDGKYLWQNYFNATDLLYDALVYTTPSSHKVAFTGLIREQASIDSSLETRGTFIHLYDTTDVEGTPSIPVIAVPSSSPSPAVPTASSSPAPVPSASPVPVVGVCSPCTSNMDCGNGRGTCVSSPIGSYCSCFSGFGGCDCSQDPDSACSSSYSEVDALSGNFQADASIDYRYPSLFVTVSANLEESIFSNGDVNSLNIPPYSTETIIFFGADPAAYPACSYPNGGFTWSNLPAVSGRCSDKYVANMNWTFALDQCGFAASAADSKLYSQTVTIQRKYKLNGVMYRTEQTTRSLDVKFPSEIEVSNSDVSVSFPSADAFAAITLIDYRPNTLKWTVQIQSSISAPYYLGAPSLALLTGNLAQRNPSVNITDCTSIDNSCVQTLTYEFGQGALSDACLGLVGIDQHIFPVSCTTPSCPIPADFNVTLRLNTGNACPATDLITFSEASLESFQDASLSTPSQSFTINDKAYFGASVQASDALISSRILKPNSVCFQPPSGPCFYVTYTLQSATAGKDPVFVVDMQHPDNLVYFSSITEATQYSVNAIVQVNFAGTKGLTKNVSQSQTVQTVSHAMILPSGESAVSSSVKMTPALSLGLLLLCLILM